MRPEKSLLFLFHRRNYDLTKPVVPSTVPYPDNRCQLRCVELGVDQCGAQRAVTQQIGDFLEWTAVLNQATGKGVAQRVRTRNGADGYVCKSSTASTLLSALSLVLAGSLYVPHQLLHPATTVDNENIGGDDCNSKAKAYCLTSRQMDILMCLADGLSNKEIGETFNLAEGTVKVHVAAVFQTLGIRRRMDAMLVAKQLGVDAMSHV